MDWMVGEREQCKPEIWTNKTKKKCYDKVNKSIQ